MRRIRESRLVRYAVVPVTLMAFLSGCAWSAVRSQPPGTYVRTEEPSKIRVDMKDGRRIVLTDPTATDSTITGRTAVDSVITIPLDEVDEIRHQTGLAGPAFVLIGGGVVLLAIALVAWEDWWDWDTDP